MSRWKAAGLHLLVSLPVAILAGSLIYFVWYPQPYFQVAGGSTLILVLIGVNVAIGPLLTLIIFRARKKGLQFDLAIIALLQIAALGYGIRVAADARPVFIVAEVDRFVLVSANQLDDEDLAAGSRPEFRTRSWFGPRLVGAVPPQYGQEAYDSVMSALAGKDIDRFPKYFVPYAEVTGSLLARSYPLAGLMTKSGQHTNVLENFLSTHADAASYRGLPLEGRGASYTMVISAASGVPFAALALDPWSGGSDVSRH